MFRRLKIKWLVWRGKAVDIWSKSTYPADVLSNLCNNSFCFDGIVCGSMEGFLQSLKYEDTDRQRQICEMPGKEAKKMSVSDWQGDQIVWWKGQTIDRQSKAFVELVTSAYQAMSSQNEKFRNALKSTRGKELYHSRGGHNPYKTILTEQEFCDILHRLRENMVDMEQKLDGEYNGHAYVDMGLSVMWATCNVGAGSPEEYGDYYAWGETETKSNYRKDNCETWRKVIDDIRWTSRDVAYVKWGGSWRMPTKTDFYELISEYNCTWAWTTLNGIKGYRVTSKKNGNSIFLPSAGRYMGDLLDDTSELGCYWICTPRGCNSEEAYTLGISDGGSFPYDVVSFCRWFGYSVRPVAELSTHSTISHDDKQTGKADVSKSTLSTLSSSVRTTSSNINGHTYVDLGLSVKWATCNVGAFFPDGFGNYFAWGERFPKEDYTIENSTTYGNSSYNHDIGGFCSMDAACANWGDSWRLPTAEEFKELIDNCQWIWTTLDGKEGYKVVSKKNGNSIFLPAAGDSYESFDRVIDFPFCDEYDIGSYWSSTPGGDEPDDNPHLACCFLFDTVCHRMDWLERYYGCSVRPVTE